jgi:hypothetical protein
MLCIIHCIHNSTFHIQDQNPVAKGTLVLYMPMTVGNLAHHVLLLAHMCNSPRCALVVEM